MRFAKLIAFYEFSCSIRWCTYRSWMTVWGFSGSEFPRKAESTTTHLDCVYRLPFPSTHNRGTDRIWEKPRDGVVKRFGQTHDIENLFVSDPSQFASSGGENPTLTIVALAIRQAPYTADLKDVSRKTANVPRPFSLQQQQLKLDRSLKERIQCQEQLE
jgi:hypothetical protein